MNSMVVNFIKDFLQQSESGHFFSKNSDKSAGDSEEFCNEQNSSDGKRKIGEYTAKLICLQYIRMKSYAF